MTQKPAKYNIFVTIAAKFTKSSSSHNIRARKHTG